MSELKNIFGVSDTDESLKGKSASGKFGLNHGTISKFEFIDDAGKDKSPGNAVDIWLKVGDRELRRRLYEVTGALFGKNNVKVEPGEEGYEDLFYTAMGQTIAVIKHALKSLLVSQESIDKVVSTIDPAKIAEGLKALVTLVPANYQTLPVDFFLEYQWSIAEDQTKTYPEVPKNMKGGSFLLPSAKPVGKWNEVRDADGLRYLDDANNQHPFERDASYMDSNKGTQQGAGVANNALSNAVAGTSNAAKSTW